MFATTNPKLSHRAILCVVVIAVLSLGGLIGAVSVQAASPWWHLGIAARPTSIQAGVAENEVQEIAVAATGGEATVIEPVSYEDAIAGGGFGVLKYATFPYDASHEEVQAALETLYGKGNVEVGGGPQGKPAIVTGTEPYVVTFVGSLAAQPLMPIVTSFNLGGLEGEATVTEAKRGQPDGQVVLTAGNLGDAPVNGETSAVTIIDKLPAHLKAVSAVALAGNKTFVQGSVRCTVGGNGETVNCDYERTLPAFTQIEVRIGVIAQAGASSSEVSEASVSGGGAPGASTQRRVAVGGETGFGIENYELTPEVEGGADATQAGSHPFQLTTTLALNENANAEPAGLPKDMTFKWPAGLIGNPTAVAQCTLGQFLSFRGQEFVNACPAQSAVGVAMVTINEPAGLLGPVGADEISTPLFNLEPEKGEPARFGFLVPGTPVVIDASVRTGSDYGITVKSDDISQTASFLKAEVVVWGTPGEAVHGGVRGNGCLRDDAEGEHLPCYPLEEQHPAAFLALPTSCPRNPSTGEPEALTSTVEGDSWVEPNPAEPARASSTLGPFDGCNEIPFKPSLTVTPDGVAGSTPSGLTTDVHVPQEESLTPNGVAEGDVKDITVALPAGLAVNPAAADGLAACTEAQIGFEGTAADGTDLFSATEPSCPDASKIGNVTIRTPVLADPLTGFVYLAAPQNFAGVPQQNPFESLVAMYLVARDPVSGVLVKLPGSVSLSETGQITARFNDTPQVPFEDASLEFYGGDRAPLATPAHCGVYETGAVFTPWSLQEGASATLASAAFNIESGPNGSACPGASLPFAPSLAAGTTNVNAGAFSPLTTTISREDGEQDIQTVQLHMPAGLSGILAGVKLCPEAQANAGTCSQESRIGSTVVSVGLGGDPYSVTGGEVFLTEKIAGSPPDAAFGLSIVNPAVAGPFDLGKVVVRARIEVDPHTAELTITTGVIPHILDGIPLEIKHVNVTIERAGFTFNPTSCTAKTITASIGSVEGAAAAVSVPFAVTNCAALKLTPRFSVSTTAKTSKTKGASLTAKLSEPTDAQGSQANIARVKVDLPIQLPSRLTTLQKACTAKQFETDPADCPQESKVGYAKVTTPLLPVALEGPAIFVSHGGEAFPSLTMVLQGYGVTIDLVGTTFVSHAGITSTTFKTVPDVPFNTFTLTLPEGKYSALAANLPRKAKDSFCGQTLTMPTEFLAQNGTKLNESTKLSITGCPKTKQARKKQKLKRKG